MKAYERLMAYAAYPTASDEASETVPSTPTQLTFGKALVDELKSLGLTDAYQNDKGFVFATIPATADYEKTVAFLAHMDVVSDVPFENVKPALVENYDGGPITLADGVSVLHAGADLVGKTLVVTDGTTLLGADDKAGVAEIMTMAEILMADKTIPHGRIRICFTPDEEIGSGILHIDTKELDADYAYTVDGGAFGEVDYETFNASSAHVEFTGRSFHPGSAKGKMIHAARVAMEFDAMLPEFERPEYTDGRDGFFHLIGMKGEVEHATLVYIIRDHDLATLHRRESDLRRIESYLNEKYGDGTVKLSIAESYRNMGEAIAPYPFLIDYAYDAIRELGGTPVSHPVRGGTDGSRLSFMGVPCPNLGTGGRNCHGRFEFAVVEEMDQTVALLCGIAKRFAK